MNAELPSLVAKHIAAFSGRTWLLPIVLDWIDKTSKRIFLLTGPPGSGKSMVAAWLAGYGPTPKDSVQRGQRNRIATIIGAAHFFQSRTGNTAPRAFAAAIARQLTARVPGFSAALVQSLADSVQISAQVEVGSAAPGANVTGIVIQELNLAGLAEELGFDRAFRDPLKTLCEGGFHGPLVLVVDSLDEAATYSDVKVVELLNKLDDLPPQVRFLITTRNDPALLNLFSDVKPFDLILDDPQDKNDVREYAYERLGLDEALRCKVADWVGRAADGNFLYAQLVLDDLPRRQAEVEDLSTIPFSVGLGGLYGEFLNRVVGAARQQRWFDMMKPVLGPIAVGRGAGLTSKQLAGMAHLNDTGPALETCRQYLSGNWPSGPFRPFHKSFADFLLDDPKNDAYHVEPALAHRQIADYYWSFGNGGGAPWQAWDDYGLRFYATHLARAAQAGGPVEQHKQTERLLRLVLNADFRKAQQTVAHDPVMTELDMRAAVSAAAADPHPQAPLLLVYAALGLSDFWRNQLRPEALFDLARECKLDDARDQLRLFRAQPEWRNLILLTLAWVAPAGAHANARAIRNQVATDPQHRPTAGAAGERLLDRLDAALGNAAQPLLSLRTAPAPFEVEEILRRVRGNPTSPTGIQPLTSEVIEGLSDDAPTFLAELDGPPLVAFAAVDATNNTRFLDEYISIHASNKYVYYRNRSLWALALPVLNHPNDDWVKAKLEQLATAALSGNSFDFREALPLTVLALDARANPGARNRLDGESERIRQEAAAVQAAGKGDPWCYHLRRLLALAELHSCALNQQQVAQALLDQARQIPFGFAGCRAPACLTFAETVRICRSGDASLIQGALDSALNAARNIQDFRFCAQLTSQVNAVNNWWRHPFDLEISIRDLVADSSAPQFSAWHIIGEQFDRRDRAPYKLGIPLEVRQAITIDALADLYSESRTDILRRNRDLAQTSGSPLPLSTPVRIPSPDFIPLLAARFSAEVLASTTLTQRKQLELIQALVPLVAEYPTALDTVLSRLLLVALPQDVDTLERLRAIDLTVSPIKLPVY